jgi:hypothetical protein
MPAATTHPATADERASPTGHPVVPLVAIDDEADRAANPVVPMDLTIAADSATRTAHHRDPAALLPATLLREGERCSNAMVLRELHEAAPRHWCRDVPVTTTS